MFLIFSLLVGSGVKLFRYYTTKDAIMAPGPEIDEKFKVMAEAVTQKSGPDSIRVREAAFLPQKQSGPEGSSARGTQKKAPSAKAEASDDFDQFRININMATAKELESIPKIGPVLARRIVDYRLEFGLFKSPEDLKKVKGVGEKTFNKIESHITID